MSENEDKETIKLNEKDKEKAKSKGSLFGDPVLVVGD